MRLYIFYYFVLCGLQRRLFRYRGTFPYYFLYKKTIYHIFFIFFFLFSAQRDIRYKNLGFFLLLHRLLFTFTHREIEKQQDETFYPL